VPTDDLNSVNTGFKTLRLTMNIRNALLQLTFAAPTMLRTRSVKIAAKY